MSKTAQVQTDCRHSMLTTALGSIFPNITLIPARICNYMSSKVCEEYTYAFPNFSSYTVEVWHNAIVELWKPISIHIDTYPYKARFIHCRPGRCFLNNVSWGIHCRSIKWEGCLNSTLHYDTLCLTHLPPTIIPIPIPPLALPQPIMYPDTNTSPRLLLCSYHLCVTDCVWIGW